MPTSAWGEGGWGSNSWQATDLEITITLTASDNSSITRGVFSNSGQTSVRDIIADNSPTLPTQYAYGSDGTDPTESDTALGNEIVKLSLTDIIIAFADTDAEWTSNIEGTI